MKTVTRSLTNEELRRFYLLTVRFPYWERHLLSSDLANPTSPQDVELAALAGIKADETVRREVLEYWLMLISLPDHELEERFRQARREGRRRIELETHFSERLPDSTAADFSWWAVFPRWTVEEAVALSLGKDPRRFVPTDRMDHIAVAYRDRLHLLKREQDTGGLPEKIAPADLVAWARGRIDLAPGLEEAVSSAVSPQHSLISQIDSLRAEVARLQNELSIPNTNRATSYLKLILLSALKNYGHRPDFPTNSTARRMQEDLQKYYGVTLTAETIHSVLQECFERVEYQPKRDSS